MHLLTFIVKSFGKVNPKNARKFLLKKNFFINKKNNF